MVCVCEVSDLLALACGRFTGMRPLTMARRRQHDGEQHQHDVDERDHVHAVNRLVGQRPGALCLRHGACTAHGMSA